MPRKKKTPSRCLARQEECKRLNQWIKDNPDKPLYFFTNWKKYKCLVLSTECTYFAPNQSINLSALVRYIDGETGKEESWQIYDGDLAGWLKEAGLYRNPYFYTRPVTENMVGKPSYIY